MNLSDEEVDFACESRWRLEVIHAQFVTWAYGDNAPTVERARFRFYPNGDGDKDFYIDFAFSLTEKAEMRPDLPYPHVIEKRWRWGWRFSNIYLVTSGWGVADSLTDALSDARAYVRLYFRANLWPILLSAVDNFCLLEE